MLTRREEDIAEVEIDEKNTALLLEWAKDKEGDRNAERTANRQVEGERATAESAENVTEGGYRARGQEETGSVIGGEIDQTA